jgi:hypothetical protein
MPFICSKSASGKWVIMMRMKNAKNFFLKTPIKFSRLTSRFSNIGIILCSTDGKHTRELIMLRQEAQLPAQEQL